MKSFNLLKRSVRLFALSVFMLNVLAVSVGASEFDLDEDGMPNDWESSYGLNPEDAADASTDLDEDGLTNLGEYLYGTDPLLADTDEDGFSDAEEIVAGTDPLVYDQADMDITDISVATSTNEIFYTAANLGTLDVDYTLEAGYTGVYVDYDETDGSYTDFYYYDWNTEMAAGSWVGTFFNAGGSETINSGIVLSEAPHTIMVCIERAALYGETAYGLDNCEIESFDLTPVFMVEAGVDEGIGFGNSYNLAAYVEGASSLTSATVDWGDGSAVENTTQTVDGDRINLGGSHLYDHKETFTVTVCANNGSEELCDVLHLSITGNSSSGGNSGGSSVTLAGDDDEEDTTDTTTTDETTDTSTDDASTEEGTDEVDQEVILSGDDEAADCSAMMFEDVVEGDNFYDAICEMWAADVIHGKTATFFDLEDVIRRDEAAKIFTRLFGYVTEAYGETPSVEESSFVDVEASDPLAYYVEVATAEEIMEPDTDSVENEDGEVVDESSFRPHDGMTAGEIADSLETILGDNEAGETLDAEGYEVDSSMTRGGFLNFLFGLVD